MCVCVCVRVCASEKSNTNSTHQINIYLITSSTRSEKMCLSYLQIRIERGKKNDDSHRGASSRRLVLLLIPFSSVKTVSCSDDGMTMWKKTVNGLVKVKIYGGNHGSKFSRQNPKCWGGRSMFPSASSVTCSPPGVATPWKIQGSFLRRSCTPRNDEFLVFDV